MLLQDKRKSRAQSTLLLENGLLSFIEDVLIRIYYPKYIIESPSSFLADPIKHFLNTYGLTRLDVIIAFL